MFTTALVTTLLLALALTAVGVRGRRTDDHPLCRRCRFDLTGRPADAERRCPECGADLAPPRATVVGHRRRRPVLLAFGLAVLLPTLALEVATFGRLSTKAYWYPYAPVVYLSHEAGSADPARRDPALTELVKRSTTGALSAWDCRWLADAALDYQGDPYKPWDEAWGDLLERFRADGRLSDDRWARYAAQALPGAMTLELRPAVRVGDPLPFAFNLRRQRSASGNAFRADIREPSGVGEIVAAGGGAPVPVKAHRGRIAAADLPQCKPDGSVYTLSVSIDVDIGESDARPGRRTLATRRLTASGSFTILKADQSPVGAVPNPSLVSVVRQSLAVTADWSTDTGPGRPPAVVIAVDSERTPFDVSFDVLVRSGGHEWPLGSFVHGRQPLGTHMGFCCPPSVDRHRPLDVIFRSNPAHAATTTIDIAQIWAGEVAFKDVPVK